MTALARRLARAPWKRFSLQLYKTPLLAPAMLSLCTPGAPHGTSAISPRSRNQSGGEVR